eukprot:GHVS01013702.1.p1 GENE.GHVS01013702.1~~GHVS01013702.1.p1  ORF type:complete len:218 (-),score=35.26 GHVS01013702.1:108-761(-)
MSTDASGGGPPPTNRPVVVFVLGGPGSGKGTQCSRISKQFGFVHISAGDCLREERSTPGSEYGPMINKHIKEGSIVPVAVTVKLLMKKMKSSGWDGGKFLIDGFPRNQDNLDGWHEVMTPDKGDKSIVDVRICLFFDCEQNEMERRLLERGTASGRLDDNPETIRKRFSTYVTETVPIAEYFSKCGKLKRVNAMQEIDAVWEDVKKLFSQAENKSTC